MLRATLSISEKMRLPHITKKVSYRTIHKPVSRFSKPFLLTSYRLYSEQTPVKTFKSSSFSLPKGDPVQNQAPENTTHEESSTLQSDFSKTRLVHGSTDLKMAITDRAKEKLVAIAKEDKKADLALKVKVESGGCHGFQYNFELVSLKEEVERDRELVVFQRQDSDMATVIFDDSSLEILQDSKLDYTHELIGSSFKMVDSPYTSTSCGCGASFDFDFEKLEKAKSKASVA